MNRERVEVTVDYLMNNPWKMYCVSLVCREVLQAMDWYLDPFKEEDRKALALYGFVMHDIARGYEDWYTSLSWFKGTLSRCHAGPRPLLTTIHRKGDFFYLGKAPK